MRRFEDGIGETKNLMSRFFIVYFFSKNDSAFGQILINSGGCFH